MSQLRNNRQRERILSYLGFYSVQALSSLDEAHPRGLAWAPGMPHCGWARALPGDPMMAPVRPH